MRIDKIKVNPVQNSVNPQLLFEIETFIQRGYEIPIELSGIVLSEDRKILTNIHKANFDSPRDITLFAQNGFDNEQQPISIRAVASLNEKVLDFIDTIRTSNYKGDVVLGLELRILLLRAKVRIRHFTMINNRDLKIEFPENLEKRDIKSIFYEYQSRFTRSQDDMWILTSDEPGIIEIKTEELNQTYTISSSDWVHDFCPVFKLGKYFVFEYVLPDYEEGSGSIEERLNESVNAIKAMKENLIKGEWNDVIEGSRTVWELLRNQDEIGDLLRRDGYTNDAINNINESLRQLFNFSSKFHHREDRGRKIMPEIKASKEDAYLIYTMSVNIVNLISKKIQRLS